MITTNRFLALMIRGSGFSAEEKDEIKQFYAQAGREAISETAKKRKILPFAAVTLSGLGYDASFWNGIAETYRARNTQILRFLDAAFAALEQHGVRKMFVSENFGALLSGNGDLALFTSGDVDCFSPFEEKEKLYRAMQSIGCRVEERYAGKLQISAEFYAPDSFALPQAFYLSVIFQPLARLKLPCFINADTFVDWNALHPYRDTHILLPPPEALLYICLLHISLHSFCRAPDSRLYVDILNAAKLPMDYDKIAQWCAADHTVVRAAVAATLANRLVKTSLPAALTNGGKRSDRILKIVYDVKNECLAPEPNRRRVFQIDVMCDDRSDARGLKAMLRPEKAWLRQVYGSTNLAAYGRHLKRMI